MIGIWTALPLDDDYTYVGYVSQMYKFVGNEVLIDRVSESLREVGTPILNIRTHLLADHTAIRQETVLQSSLSSKESGDIHPVMIIGNSYNGHKAATVSFGIAVDSGEVFTEAVLDITTVSREECYRPAISIDEKDIVVSGLKGLG